MNQSLMTVLASQRPAQLRAEAEASRRRADARRRGKARRPRESLRVRAGWTLVGLGLRLAARPGATDAT